MLSTADLLLGRLPIPGMTVRKAKPLSPSSINMQKNADKPCAHPGCDEPRHIAPSGRCMTTLCTAHYKQRGKDYRDGKK